MGCNCGKPKCDGKCGISPAVLQINNPTQCVIFHKVDVPASMGDSTTNPPKTGAYKNVLLYYEADQTSWLYSSDGIPVRLTNGITNYEDAINLPQINGETLIGDKSSADLKLADAPMVITIASDNTSWSGADTAEDIYNFFLNQGKVNVVFDGSENYGYGIVSAAYIPGEQKMMCMVAVAGVDTGSSPVDFAGNALYGLMTFYTAGKAVDVGELDLQLKLSITDFTGLDIIDGYILEGVPATGFSIGMVKPGDGLEVASDGTLSVNTEVAHTFDTVADMKASTELKNGDYAQTLGYYAINDGGGALYKITSTGTANGMDVISVGELYANLVVDEPANVVQFGAYGDNTHDDKTVLQYVLANYGSVYMPDKTYLVATTLELTRSNQTIRCDGNINYSGNNTAILYKSGIDNDIHIRKITSNKIGILVQPTASCGRNKLDITYIDSQTETFKVLGNYSSSSWYLYGLRWNSVSGYAITFEIPSGSTNVFFNRFIFNNMALLAHASDTKGILLTDNGGTGCEIQVQFDMVNFENAKGIRCTGKVGYLTINNCRLAEIANTDWLEFNGNIPNTVITGAGRVYLSRIKFLNITSGEHVVFNIRVQDASSYSYSGGAIVRADNTNFIFVPNDNTNTHNAYVGSADSCTIGDEIGRDTTVAYVLPQRIRITNTNASTEVVVPNWMYNNKGMVMLQVATATTVTLKYGTGTVGTFAGNKNYLVVNQGSFAKAVEIS